MAHLAHYKQSGYNNLVAHYNREPERRGYQRDNIDPYRWHENYVVGAADSDELAQDVRARVRGAVEGHREVAGRKLKSTANVMSDWVVTLPRDCPEEFTREFFDAVFEFVQTRYGKENVLGGFVHMDESQPHMHVPLIPVVEGRLNSRELFTRKDLQSFHKELGAYVDERLGFHTSIELDEERKGEKELSHLEQTEYIAAKERLECLRQEVKAMEATYETPSERRERASKAREAERECQTLGEREQGLKTENRSLRTRYEWLRKRVGELRKRIGEATVELREFIASIPERKRAREEETRERIQELNGLCAELRGRAGELESELKHCREAAQAAQKAEEQRREKEEQEIKAPVQELEVEPEPVYEAPSLSSLAGEVRAASRALSDNGRYVGVKDREER